MMNTLARCTVPTQAFALTPMWISGEPGKCMDVSPNTLTSIKSRRNSCARRRFLKEVSHMKDPASALPPINVTIDVLIVAVSANSPLDMQKRSIRPNIGTKRCSSMQGRKKR